MKRLLYIVISIVIATTIASSGQPSYGTNKSITLQSTGKNIGSEALKNQRILFPPLKCMVISSFE